MQVGKLRNRITIEQRTATRSASGAVTFTWSTAATVWAQVEQIAGTEQSAPASFEASAHYRIRIRYRAGIDTTMRLGFGSQKLEIQALNNVDQRNAWIDITAQSGVSHGNQ